MGYMNKPKIDRDQVMAHTTFHFIAEASELEWSPGFFPDKVDTDIGNQQPLVLKECNSQMALYSQVAGCIEVTVYND